MSTVLDALRKAESGKSAGGGFPGEPPPEPPRRRGGRVLLVLLGCVALGFAFLVGIELSGNASSSDRGRLVAVAPQDETGSAEFEATVGSEAALAPDPEVVANQDSSAASRLMAAAPPAKRATAPAESSGVVGTEPIGLSAPVARATEPASVAAVQTRAPVRLAQAQLEPAPAQEEEYSDREARRRELRELREERRAERGAKRQQLSAASGPGAADREKARQERRAGRAAEREQRRTGGAKGAIARETAREERRAARAERRAKRFADRYRARGGQPETAAQAPARPSAEKVVVTASPPVAAAPAAVVPEQGASVPEGGGETVAVRRAPSSAPQVRINILQWSRDPQRRFAYVSLEGDGSMTQIREGEIFQGLEVKRIFPEEVEFEHQGGTFLLSAN